jgi:hypothetical protein
MPRFYFHKHLNGQTVPDRRTHDLCCERKGRHREALRPHFSVGGLGTFFPGAIFIPSICRAAKREALLR